MKQLGGALCMVHQLLVQLNRNTKMEINVNFRELSLKGLRTKIYLRMLRSLAWISPEVAPGVANGAFPQIPQHKDSA